MAWCGLHLEPGPRRCHANTPLTLSRYKADRSDNSELEIEDFFDHHTVARVAGRLLLALLALWLLMDQVKRTTRKSNKTMRRC